jgi:hypothetical protein
MQPPTASPRVRLRVGPRSAVLLVLLAGALSELALARLGYGNPRLIRADERRGYALVGDQDIAGPHGTLERINVLGFRERDWSDSPTGRPLVVVLGHSVSYGVGVDAGERWTARLESSLRGGAAPGACVLDLAVPGYTLEQMRAVYDEVARALAPDVVVTELGDYSIRPMVRLEEPADFPLSRWIRRTALFDFWRRKLGRVRGGEEQTRQVLEDPSDAANDPLWDAAFARLDALREELGARGARLVLLHTPSAAGVFDRGAPRSRWHAWCAARPDVIEVDCAELLRERMAPLVAESSSRAAWIRAWSTGGSRSSTPRTSTNATAPASSSTTCST